jgi:hypothetical protein
MEVYPVDLMSAEAYIDWSERSNGIVGSSWYIDFFVKKDFFGVTITVLWPLSVLNQSSIHTDYNNFFE